MFDITSLKPILLTGNFGLEKESLRINTDGTMSHSPNPFVNNNHIVRDFCENQVEINTDIFPNAHLAVEAIRDYTKIVQKTLKQLKPREILWPFSNPPYIKNEDDIPVAIFKENQKSKTEYRKRLAERYGKYKMTFSGIHFNYSFSEELLEEAFKLSKEDNFVEFKNRLYLKTAKKAVNYGWLISTITAASPVLDGSFMQKGHNDEDLFLGLSSIRCSEMGYWNNFSPILDYTDIDSYVKSIQSYVNDGFISAASELYYPKKLNLVEKTL